MEGESGRNELLWGPFALFGVRSSAKLVRDLAKHRRTPMSPPQLIPPTSPGQIIAGDGRLRRRFSHTGHGPFRALIVSNLKWGEPCRGHYVFPAGRYQIQRNSFVKAHGRHIVFPVHGSTAWPRQGPSPHLTRETTITCTLRAQVIVINLLKHQMYQTSNKHTLTNTLSHIQYISNTYESA